jgi:hypothetical protein
MCCYSEQIGQVSLAHRYQPLAIHLHTEGRLFGINSENSLL